MNKILDNLLKVFEKNKSDPFLQYGIAIEYRNAGEFEKSLEFFKKVYENFPDYVPNYYHFAQLLDTNGDSANARRICEEGILIANKAGDEHAASELRQALDSF